MRVYIRRRPTMSEILSNSRAYEEYEEDGECSWRIEEEISPSELRTLLAPRLVRILEVLSQRSMDVPTLAERLDRSPTNVYSDIKLLSKYNIVEVRREDGRGVVSLLAEEIRVEL